MSRDTTTVVPGEEARVDHSILKFLSIILMVVFGFGIILYGIIARDAFEFGHWTGF